jgi:hypothetical protein
LRQRRLPRRLRWAEWSRRRPQGAGLPCPGVSPRWRGPLCPRRLPRRLRWAEWWSCRRPPTVLRLEETWVVLADDRRRVRGAASFTGTSAATTAGAGSLARTPHKGNHVSSGHVRFRNTDRVTD